MYFIFKLNAWYLALNNKSYLGHIKCPPTVGHHLVCNWSSTTGGTSGAGTDYPSGAPEFTPVFLVGFALLDL